MKEVSEQIPNNFILSTYNTSVIQRRIVYGILMQVEKVMEYTASNNNPVFEVPKNIVMDGYSHTQLKDGCKGLIQKAITVVDDDLNEEFAFIMPFSKIAVTKESSFVEITLNREMAKIFYELKKGYSKIDYQSCLALSSKFAQKLYEIFSMKINNYEEGETAMWFTTIDEVKTILDVKDKYKQNRDFKLMVLETIKKQINSSTNLEISYELEKKGRAYHYLTFYINENQEKSDFEKIEIALEDEKSKRCLSALVDLGIFDKKIQKVIIEQYQQAFWKWNQ